MRKATNQLRLLLLTVLAVLTVSIGVQAASGRTPSRQMDRRKSITKETLGVNIDALTAIQGKTRTAVCSFSDSGYLTYEISDTGIVSCSWGKWYNEGKNINLTIKGKAEGTCTVTISNSANEETRVIRVTVRRNQLLNTETLTARKGASRTVTLNLRTGTPSFSVSDPSILTCTKKSAVRKSDGSISYAYTIQGNAEGAAYVYFTNSYNEEKTTLKVTVPSSAVIMRAVVIGEVDYPISNKIPACRYDANAMESTLRQTGYADVYKKLNVSKMQIRSAIRNTFAGADSNDISLFYYSGHGGSTGSLYPISNGEEEDITPGELASWLSDVPGTVIVILDCCGSGGVIDKAAGSGAADLFNTCVVNAFAEADVYGKSGELCTGKFRVITACQKDTYSYCASKYSYFTKALVDGAGFDYTYGTRQPSAPADGNRNGTVSVYEAWYYINKHVDAAKQKTQYYPLKSATTVFRR